MIDILLPIVSVVVGVFFGWLSFRLLTSKKIKQAHVESKKIKEEAKLKAKVIKKEAEIEAKENWYKRKANLEKEIEERKKELRKIESNYNQRISNIDDRLSKLDRREQSISDRERHLQNKQTRLDDEEAKLKDILEKETIKLMEIANLNKTGNRNASENMKMKPVSMQPNLENQLLIKLTLKLKRILSKSLQMLYKEQLLIMLPSQPSLLLTCHPKK